MIQLKGHTVNLFLIFLFRISFRNKNTNGFVSLLFITSIPVFAHSELTILIIKATTEWAFDA